MLEIRSLQKTYPNGKRALDGIELSVPPGMFGLLGPNGAGKSTLMRSIAGLQDVDAGTIHFGGLDVAREPQKVREILGYLPQDFGVYPRVSALEMLDHLAILKGLRSRGERRDVVEALLRKTNLWDVRKKALSGYSGGMRQRFGVAQALIGNPRLVIVDEPTAGLDPEERNRFHDLLSEIGEQVVVMLSTHIVEDVANLCSQVAIMANGRVVLKGGPSELVAGLEGRIWERTVDRKEAESLRERYDVLSARLVAGHRQMRVYAEHPPAGFEGSAAGLEDVYFHAIQQSGRIAPAEAA